MRSFRSCLCFASLFVALSNGSTAAATLTMSASMKAFIVDAHNAFRRTKTIGKAANMRKLGWSEALAKEAALLVETCPFEHRTRGYGQNLYYSSGYGFFGTNTVDQAMRGWGDEELPQHETEMKAQMARGDAMLGTQNFDHASQLLWANTYQVGCAAQQCGSQTHFYCNYYPPGNFVGQRWYKVGGAPCSQCPSTAPHCDAGLCTMAAGIKPKDVVGAPLLVSKEQTKASVIDAIPEELATPKMSGISKNCAEEYPLTKPTTVKAPPSPPPTTTTTSTTTTIASLAAPVAAVASTSSERAKWEPRPTKTEEDESGRPGESFENGLPNGASKDERATKAMVSLSSSSSSSSGSSRASSTGRNDGVKEVETNVSASHSVRYYDRVVLLLACVLLSVWFKTCCE